MARHRIAILLSGRGSNMQALVDAASAADCPYEVVLVASDRPDAPGLAWAAAHGIATFAHSPRGIPKAEYEAAIDGALRAADAEVVALAGYMRLLSDGFVQRWRGRIVNIHPSLLPLYKGLDTHARALASGDAVAGCSVHVVTEELDAGAVIGRAEVPVIAGDTPDALAARVLVEEHRLYPRCLAAFVRAADGLGRVRAVASLLPEVSERDVDGTAEFAVAGEAFVQVPPAAALRIRAEDGWQEVALNGDTDWTLVEDAVARGWELSAPRGLLEAGGR